MKKKTLNQFAILRNQLREVETALLSTTKPSEQHYQTLMRQKTEIEQAMSDLMKEPQTTPLKLKRLK